MSDKVSVSVNILESGSDKVIKKSLKKLKQDDNLSKIRKVLSCDDKLLFLKNGSPVDIEDEKKFSLKEILTIDARKNNSIYLKKQIFWDVLNENHKLDHGRIISNVGTKSANNRAFILEGFKELKEIDKRGKGTIEIRSNEEFIKNKNLLFNIDISINNLIKLGLSRETAQEKILRDGNNLSYNYTEVVKASLKLNRDDLKPTDEIIKAINGAIKSKDIKKFIDDYGLFIPTEITMGGRFYTNETLTSTKKSNNNTKTTGVNAGLNANVMSLSFQNKTTNGISKDKSTFHKVNNTIILGGNCDGDVFNEKKWTESLKDYRNWECIEFNTPISIFQLIPGDLRKKVYKFIGKKILYTGTLDCKYHSNQAGIYRKFELLKSDNIPENILNIIQNEEADCDFFATAVDINQDSKNVFFTCQILKQKAEDGKKIIPSIIIHAIQKEFQPCEYNLKIVLMVVGYDIEFDYISADNCIEVVKGQYSQNTQNIQNKMLHSLTLETTNHLMGTNYPFFGISILNNLNDPNDSLIIGHNFYEIQSNHELKIDLFSYCSKKNRYLKLPNFTFCALIILEPNTYTSLPFEFRMFKKPFISLSSQNKNPKYVSFLRKTNDHRPIFLNQKIKQINIKYVRCRCKRKEVGCICGKTRKISKKDIHNCIVFDPYKSRKYFYDAL
ncbi:hypothetical protein GLOIN_2v1815663 [Rhizophagus irregularis DAOM 181602=DAOM 197198]|uniref:Uncharacterized protein n=3 Tax=Rhizophagus irregularis TaxID=588596 RepID=A0A2P4QJ13_RHIID|nr:hypothetical protein GLOIN_2v1815663 [Rhizophagus irregularis DAOM 181602=DAOM 197198]POG77635.1 hypothetical protein GLOIN_2v1815663 [Rhizophagus irregularis DAOM 181602=DAOM 197198]|eukprot:XP_025184501.1 hypothetical protein GLOIN_2v1815663 [Rhizophagus irregularis DAOM 181602=DAOM 197198]